MLARDQDKNIVVDRHKAVAFTTSTVKMISLYPKHMIKALLSSIIAKTVYGYQLMFL